MAFKKPKLAEAVALLDSPPAINGLNPEALQVIKLWTLAVLFANSTLEDEEWQPRGPDLSGVSSVRNRRQTDQFEYVYEIVDYLLRYDRFPDGRDRFKLEDAKDFAWAIRGEILEVRTVAKYWEENRLAAPYIYALFRLRCVRAADLRQREAINGLTKLFSNERRVRRLFGHAAYAADVLAKLVDQREGDFKDVKRVCPSLEPFSEAELGLVQIPTRRRPLK